MSRRADATAILIAGPTASGKSALALAVAERVGGVVVNADSMQVYRELAILTARPSEADLARAPHALYGFVSGAEAYSAGRYAVDAARAVAEARAKSQMPIIVGGTGLYFKRCWKVSRRSRQPTRRCVPIGAGRLPRGRRRSCMRCWLSAIRRWRRA